ncbi:MAG TPA: hypothetical protein ENJ18_08560, partial [Nannocystis exedens]|nr:hypothetical protein [Nannocystis exedens]
MRHRRHIHPFFLCSPLLVLSACPENDPFATTTDSATDSQSTGSNSDTTTSETEGDSDTTTTSSTGDGTTAGSTSDSDSDSGDTENDTMPGVCGDLIVDEGEECDDGNLIPDDGCEPDCTLTPANDQCGDNQLDPDEACDGEILPIQDCTVIDGQYSGGELSCAENCSFDTSACEVCEAPGEVISCDGESDELLHALGLACNTLGVDFSDTNKHIPVTNFDLQSADTDAYRVITQFGSHMVGNKPKWGPREGSKLLAISTGNLPEPDGEGVLLAPPGSAQTGITQNDNPNNLPSLPGIMHHEKGSNNGQGGTPFLS